MRRFVGALVGLVMLATLVPSSPAGSGTETDAPSRVERVLIFSLPVVTWADLGAADLPHLDAFLDEAAVAALSVRAVNRSTSATDGYATLGAGARARGSAGGVQAFTTGEEFDGSVASEEFARRTGVEPAEGELFDMGIVQVIGANQSLDFGAEPGELGDTLDREGVDRAVIGSADRRINGEIERQAAVVLGLMGGNGIVPSGTIGASLLVDDPTAPFALRTDIDRAAEAFAREWNPAGERRAVLVEASDVVRWDNYRSLVTARQRATLLRQALERTDELFGALMAEVDPERDAVIVVGPYHRSGSAHLTVAAMQAPGVEPGLLRSGTTRRSGFVTLADVAPTILDLFAIERPDAMEGRPWVVGRSGGSASDRRELLIDADHAAAFRDDHVAPASTWYVIGHAVLWILAAITLHRGSARFRSVVEVLALAGITFLPATHLATLLPFHEWGDLSWWAFLAGTAVALAVVAWALGRRNVVDGLAVALGMVVALLTVDILLGAPLQLNAVFGYSPTIAGRFAGFGNLAFAQLGAAALMLAGVLAYRLGGRRGLAAAAAVLVGAVILDGAPFWGSDVGGVLALVPAAATTLWLLSGRRVRIRNIVLWGSGAVIAVLAFGFVDLLRPEESQTHLGRLLGAIGDNGYDPLHDVVVRKIDANLGVLTSSIWTLMVPVVIAFVGYLFWRAPGALQRVSTHVPTERPALAGLLVVMFLGFALNDSGIAVPGVMLGVLNASLVYLLLRTAGEPVPVHDDLVSLTDRAADDDEPQLVSSR
jgi:hypothetical protein